MERGQGNGGSVERKPICAGNVLCIAEHVGHSSAIAKSALVYGFHTARNSECLHTAATIEDSICKYAPLQCDAVDSAYQEKLSQNLQNLHEMYDYSRLQAENSQKELQLQESRRKVLYVWCALALVIACALFVVFYLRSWYRQRITSAELKLERANAELEERENNLQALRDELARVEDEKERQRLAEEVEQAERETEEQSKVVMLNQEKLDELRLRVRKSSKNLRSCYYTTPLFQSLLQRAETNKAATELDYKLVEKALLEKDGDLMQRFHASMPTPSETERHIFLLLRFGNLQPNVDCN